VWQEFYVNVTIRVKTAGPANLTLRSVVYTREGSDNMLMRISQYEWSFSNTAEAATALLLAAAIVLTLFA
jgi:hypothetical protein